MSEEKKHKLKEYQKIIGKLKRLNLVINTFYGFNVCYALVMHCQIHIFMYFRLT